MQVRNQLAGNTNSYHSYSLDEALSGISAAGFRYVELSSVRGWTEHVSLEADAQTLADLRRTLQRLRLEPVSLGGHSDLSTTEGLERGLKALHLCERLGVAVLITAAGAGGGIQAFLDNTRHLADRAAALDVRLALEVAGELAGTGQAALALIERLDHPNIFINYDTANVEYYGGLTATDDLPSVLAKVAHIHLKDKQGGKGVWDFPAIGDGHVDFRTVLDIVAAGGFTGPLSVEVEFLGEPWPPLAKVDYAMRLSYERLVALGLS